MVEQLAEKSKIRSNSCFSFLSFSNIFSATKQRWKCRKWRKCENREGLRLTQFASEGFRAQLKTAMRVWSSAHALDLLRGSSAQNEIYEIPTCLVSVWFPRKARERNKKKTTKNKKLYLNIGNDREEENGRDSERKATRIHFFSFSFFRVCLFWQPQCSVLGNISIKHTYTVPTNLLAKFWLQIGISFTRLCVFWPYENTLFF